jgi:hypothetical protein
MEDEERYPLRFFSDVSAQDEQGLHYAACDSCGYVTWVENYPAQAGKTSAEGGSDLCFFCAGTPAGNQVWNRQPETPALQAIGYVANALLDVLLHQGAQPLPAETEQDTNRRVRAGLVHRQKDA